MRRSGAALVTRAEPGPRLSGRARGSSLGRCRHAGSGRVSDRQPRFRAGGAGGDAAVGTVRRAGLAHALRARHVATVVTVEPLGDDLVSGMAAACLGGPPPSDVDALLRAHADGLPFLVEELLAALVDSAALARERPRLGAAPRARAGGAVDVCPDRAATARRTRRQRPQSAGGCGRVGPELRLVAAAGGDRSRRSTASSKASKPRSRRSSSPRLARHDPVPLPSRVDVRRGSRLIALGGAAVDGPGGTGRGEQLQPDVPGEWCQLAADLARQAGDQKRSAELLLELGRRSVEGGAIATGVQVLDQARLMAPKMTTCGGRSRSGSSRRWPTRGRSTAHSRSAKRSAARMASTRIDVRRRATVHLVLAAAASGATDWASPARTSRRRSACWPNSLTTSSRRGPSGWPARSPWVNTESTTRWRTVSVPSSWPSSTMLPSRRAPPSCSSAAAPASPTSTSPRRSFPRSRTGRSSRSRLVAGAGSPRGGDASMSSRSARRIGCVPRRSWPSHSGSSASPRSISTTAASSTSSASSWTKRSSWRTSPRPLHVATVLACWCRRP